MRVNDEIESDPRPRLSIKLGYDRTDVSEPGRGNTLIVPGSHLQNEIDLEQDGQSIPDEAEPVCVRPGGADIVKHHRRRGIAGDAVAHGLRGSRLAG